MQPLPSRCFTLQIRFTFLIDFIFISLLIVKKLSQNIIVD